MVTVTVMTIMMMALGTIDRACFIWNNIDATSLTASFDQIIAASTLNIKDLRGYATVPGTLLWSYFRMDRVGELEIVGSLETFRINL